MKRAPIVLTSTALGVAGVLSYHSAGSSAGSASSASATTATASTGTASTSSASSGSTSKRSATGDDVSFQYGDIQVKVTMSGRRITGVSVVQLNESDPHSADIDQSAVPQLNQEVISGQSGQIHGVSGASYTSQAYEQSLQSALDKLGLKT